MRSFFVAAFFFIAIVSSSKLIAQGKQSDYDRANSLKDLFKDKALGVTTDIAWAKGTSQILYAVSTANGKQFILANVSKHEKKPAFDRQVISKKLSEITGKDVDSAHLPLTRLRFSDNDQGIEFAAFNREWSLNFLSRQVEEVRRPKRSANDNDQEILSPDHQLIAYIKNYNLYIRKAGQKEAEIQLSFDGSANDYYDDAIVWAPDSKKIAVNKVKGYKEHKLYLIESSPKDQLQPKLHTNEYLKPGDSLKQFTPVLFWVESKKVKAMSPDLIRDQYSLSVPVWRKDSRSFTIEYNQRGHQQYCVIEMNASSGEATILIDEKSKTFIHYSGKKYRYDVNDGKEVIWASERDGWNHLYLYDGITKKVKNQITKGNWVVREVKYIDEKKREIIFAASGREKDQDPYLKQYYKINFNGKGLKNLTKESANHIATFSSGSDMFVDQYSRVDLPPVTVVRSAFDGKVLMELETADIKNLLNTGWKAPEVFTGKGRDGITDIWGVITRPINFDPQKTYPVIEYIYAGPHDSFVPKSFEILPGNGSRELAELGFIVVQMDGMGTSNRSKAFHDVCWRNLKDAGFPDRIEWIKAAAKKYPYMDISKMGIYGTSAGGQSSAGALLFHPEFYKVAVSSCGCHDNRMDKIWWNEQWMGYPIGPQYAESSNVDNAYRLKGKLMLMVGELDDNVDPSSTLQVVDALIKANKNFDFLMLPGLKHTSGGDYGEHKRRDYFVKHLLGLEPPAW